MIRSHFALETVKKCAKDKFKSREISRYILESLNMSDYPALRKQIENIGDTNIANDPRFVNTNRARQCWVNYAVSLF